MTTSARLRAAMQDAGVTHLEMAAAMNISRSRLSQILSGAEMKQSQITAACSLLGISADWLLTGGDPEHQELIDLYQKLSPEARAGLIKLLRG
ncbi:helix-turn-helix transcriptional regulator [Oceanospirillum sp. HFRX-1_2]